MHFHPRGNSFGKTAPYTSKHHISYYSPNVNDIEELCAEQQIDGVIVRTVTFVQMNYYLAPVPVAVSSAYDAEVGLKLFDKHGTLLISNVYYTKAAVQSQQKSKFENTISLGATGAVKGMVKNIYTRVVQDV